MENEIEQESYEAPENIWMRGLYMIIFALFFGVAETLLAVMAVVQFFWMLFKREKNQAIADFGTDLGRWLRRVAEFQTGSRDEKPFPWAGWKD